MDESEAIARVLAGEREAFHGLLERHTAPILATLRASGASREDAREILQETWLRAFESLGRLRDPARLRAWLLSIALNLARARHRVEPPAQRLGPLAEPSTESHDPLASLAQAEAWEELERELALRLAELPARQREVVDLRVNHELPHSEIGRLLGISEGASRASYYQALKRLREAFTSRENP